MAESFRVPSIDGGGIRGIIPATILAEIEDRTGRAIAEMFDLIAGTSTGGILALALTMPGDGGKPRYRAEDLISLYEKEGRRIFSRPPKRRATSSTRTARGNTTTWRWTPGNWRALTPLRRAPGEWRSSRRPSRISRVAGGQDVA